MKIIIVIILISLSLFSRGVYAVTTTIDNFPSTISTDPFTINITISGASAGTNYLRIDLYKPSTSNYFGETFNGIDWYGGSTYTQYFPITIQSGNDWSGQIQARFGSPILTQYDGPGSYKMRVRRYTSSGNYTPTEAATVDITINVPIPTPTPTITPIDAVTPTPTETLTLTITPTIMITPIPTEIPTPTPTPQSYNNIYISEVMTNPPSGKNEWVELFNNNDYSVSLIDWFIDDIENTGSSPKLFSLDIPAKNYRVIELSSSMFNNTGDSVRLLDFNKNRIDDFEYFTTTQGKTLGRVSYDSDEFCLQEPSKGSINNSCINPTPTPILRSQPTHKLTNIPYLSVTAVMNRSINTSYNSTPMNLSAGRQVESIGEGKVLGISSQNYQSNDRIIRSLSFISFSYSLLAIISVVLKIKFAYNKLRNESTL